MLKPRVGVLRGGPSSEYDVSLKTGASVLAHLPAARYELRDMLIDKEGQWHLRGRPVEPTRALDQVDVVFNALHGAYGEDGTVQRLLETHGTPYTGSGTLASALGMHKALAKDRLAEAPFLRAHHRVVRRGECGEEALAELIRTLPQPFVVKPATGGSSVGVSITYTQDELLYAVVLALEVSEQVMLEQLVRGREVTVAVVEGLRGEDLYALPPVEIIPTRGKFFDYDEKYAGHARELCPAPLPHETTEALLEAARYVHRTLGLRDYSRSDFIVGRDGIYFLEVNTLPGLTEASLVPKAAAAVGISMPQLVEHLVGRALVR